jgi:hypothetical protein
LSLFSVVALFAHRLMPSRSTEVVRRAAWYDKSHPTTFTDALALVRKELWAQAATFYESSHSGVHEY